MPAQLFILYTLASAAQQGIIAWLFREYVPTKRLDWINAALHTGGGLLYALFVAVVLHGWGGLTWAAWPLLVDALLVRWLLFDVVLNLTRAYFDYREGRGSFFGISFRPFEVGTAAVSDRLMRWVAGWLGIYPPMLRAGAWVVALGLAIGFHFLRPA